MLAWRGLTRPPHLVFALLLLLPSPAVEGAVLLRGQQGLAQEDGASTAFLSAHRLVDTLLETGSEKERRAPQVAAAAAAVVPPVAAGVGPIKALLSRGRTAAAHLKGRFLFSQLSSSAHALDGPHEPHIVIRQGMDDEAVEEQVWADFMTWVVGLVSMMVWACFATVMAHYYLSTKKAAPVADLAAGEEEFKDFRYGVCECFQRPDVSLWVCCCPSVRWADNMSTMGIFRCFWFAFALFLSINLLGGESQDFCGWFILALLGAGFRQELRDKFQMARRGGWTYAEDFFLYFCCMCCVITQEARHVEDAYRAKHPAVVKKADDEQLAS